MAFTRWGTRRGWADRANGLSGKCPLAAYVAEKVLQGPFGLGPGRWQGEVWEGVNQLAETDEETPMPSER